MPRSMWFKPTFLPIGINDHVRILKHTNYCDHDRRVVTWGELHLCGVNDDHKRCTFMVDSLIVGRLGY